MALQDELAVRMKGCARRGRGNYFVAYLLLVVAVAASATATIAVAAGDFPKELNAVLAALPGIIVLATNTFKFEARADWWWTKHAGLDEMWRALIYDGRNSSDVNKELSKFLREHDAKWPSFGKPPSGPHT